MRSSALAKLEKTLEPYLVSPSDVEGPALIYRSLIESVRNVFDRAGKDGYRFQPSANSYIPKMALNELFVSLRSEGLGAERLSLAKPFEQPSWMSDCAYRLSINESYRNTFSTTLRQELDKDGFLPKYPLYRLVRSALDIALKDRLSQAFRATLEQSGVPPHAFADELAENMIETFALGFTFTLPGSSGGGYWYAKEICAVAKTFAECVPLGRATEKRCWILAVA